MILKQLQEWLAGAEQALPQRRLSKLRRAVDAFGREHAGGRWRLGVPAGTGVKALGLRWHAGDPQGPCMTLEWDLEKDKGGAWLSRPRPKAQPLTAAFYKGTELEALFVPLQALAPVASIVSEPGGWSMVFSLPVPWTRFAGLDLAKPFEGEGTLLAYLLLDRRVHELSFRDSGPRAYLGA